METELENRKEKLLMTLFNQQILITKSNAKKLLADAVLKYDLSNRMQLDKIIKFKQIIKESEFITIDTFENLKGFDDLLSLATQITRRPNSFTPRAGDMSVVLAKDWLAEYERCEKTKKSTSTSSTSTLFY